MNLQFYIEKLQSSENYKKFISENPEAFFCSGFFIIDLENEKNPDNKEHLDFFVPEKGEIVSFQLENDCALVPVEEPNIDQNKKLDKISFEVNFNFKEVREIIEQEMEKQKVKNKIQKIILSLQSLDGKPSLIGTVFISGYGLVKIRIELEDMSVADFEKKSFLDMVNVFKKDKEKV